MATQFLGVRARAPTSFGPRKKALDASAAPGTRGFGLCGEDLRHSVREIFDLRVAGVRASPPLAAAQLGGVLYDPPEQL